MYHGHQVTEIAMTVFVIEGCMTAANASASSSAGNARKTSVTRKITSSTQPPKYPAAIPSGTPIEHRDREHQHRDHRRDARAVDHAREHVPPHLVRPEVVLGRGRLERLERVRGAPGVLRVRRDERREQGHEDDREAHRGADREQRVPPDDPGHAAEAAGRREDLLAALEVRVARDPRHQLTRIRGSIMAWTMSTSRLPITYTIATNSVTPRIAGVSSAPIASAA